jgi:P2-related tail formation protein
MAQNYFKRNFVDAVEIITPDLYLEDDFAVSGIQVADINEVINSHLFSAEKVASTLALSSIVGSNLFSALGNIKGFSQYFIKQNKLTNITTQHFQDKILTPLSIKISSYSTSGLFATYLSGTLLPKLYLKSPTLLTDTSSVFGTSVEDTVKYLLENLGWLALLNSSGPAYDGSTIIASTFIKKVYDNKTSYQINDGVKDYQEYLWKNYSSFSSIDYRVIPDRFTSGTGSYTSGNQNLDKLKTLVDVIYSPLTLDQDDTLVQNAFQNYINTDSLLTSTESAGPFSKFLRGIAYSMYDINDQVAGLENLLSIDKCPAEYLPLLAEMIGWRLYGKNEQSWRNQLQNAASIYRKRGTKQGLIDAFNAIIIQNPINTSGALTELYESYVPRLIFYALMTESPLFVDENSYTQADALAHGCAWEPQNIVFNVRAVVDKIIQDSVARFPDLFRLKGDPFRITRLVNGRGWFGPVMELGNMWVTAKENEEGELIPTEPAYEVETLADPDFVFNYRGSNHPIPPWNHEKFYANCAITSPLINFIKTSLDKFCVPKSMINALGDYVYQYTVAGHPTSDLYIDNGFVFFTSSQHFAPNTESILANYDSKDYDYLSMWSGKSSTFDFSVHGGEFIAEVFGDVSSIHTVNEILESLAVVNDMTPAKAIPKVKFSKKAFESASGADYLCPSVRLPFQEVQDQSGAIANTEVCGVFDRGTGYALGYQKYPDYDDSRSTVSHANVPVFEKVQVEYGFNVLSSVINTSATVPDTSAIPRRTIRRRNFQNAIPKSGWFDRAGRNMPCFYNNTSSLLDFVPLGYNASTGGYAPPNADNLLGVYGLLDCSTTTSNKNYFGVDVSNTFLTRSNASLLFSSCDQFVRRGMLPEAVKLFFDLEEKRKYAISRDILKANYFALNGAARSWENLVANFANVLPDQGYSKYYSPALDIRKLKETPHGVHYIYQIFNQFFSGGTHSYDYLPENFLTTYKMGGPNILSHIYGPIYENSNFKMDGSALSVSAQLVSKSLNNIYPINLAVSTASLASIGLKEDNLTTQLLENTQYSTKHILSGIVFVDSSTALTPTNEFVVLDLDPQSLPSENEEYLINNRNMLMRSRSHGLPRIRFGLRNTQQNNILLPDHEFELTLNYLTSEDRSAVVGKSGLGVMIRTKTETTVDGDTVIFIWTKNNKWEMVYMKDLQTENSRELILNKYAHIFRDETRQIADDAQESGCGVDDVLRTLDGVNKESYSKGVIKFNTSNKPRPPVQYGTYYNASLLDVYNGRRNQLHRADLTNGLKTQNYFLEIFALPTNSQSTKFTLLDEISLVDTTLNDAAKIPYDACIPDLTKGRGVVSLPTLYNTAGDKVKPVPIEEVQGADIWNPGGVTGPNLLYFPEPFILHEHQDYSPGLTVYKNNSLLTSLMKNVGVGCLYPRVTGHPPFDLMSYTYQAFRPLPYTGCYGETWTNCQWGWDNFYGGAGSRGVLQGFNTVAPVIFEGFTRDYFKERGAMYVNTEAGPSFDLSVGTWASFGRWSDLTFNGQIRQHPQADVATTWYPNPQADPSGITNKKITHPLRAMQGATTQTQYGFRQQGGYNKIKNPLGYTAVDDLLEYAPMDHQYAGNCYPIGSPTMLGFISRRYHPEWPTASIEQTDIMQTRAMANPATLNQYSSRHYWFNENESHYQHKYNGVNYGQWGIGEIGKNHNFNRLRALPTEQGIYYDIHADKLLNGQKYTFTAYIAKPPTLMGQFTNDSWGYPNGTHGQSTSMGGQWEQYNAGACTSAAITLSPIDTSSTFSKVVLDLDTGTPEFTKGGEGLTATCSAISYTTPDPVTWYKLQVSINYNALEKDALYSWANGYLGIEFPLGADRPNYGIRCSVQGVNTRADNLINPPDDPTAPIDIPGCLMVWGTALTLGDKVQWSRGTQDTLDAYQFYDNPTVHPQVIYHAYGVEDSGYYDNDVFPVSTDQIINVGSNGELSYTDPNTSSLDKITLAVPSDEIQDQKLYTSSLLYDISGNQVTNTQIILDSTERLMLGEPSVHKYNEYSDNLLEARHEYTTSSQGTNINFCTAGTIPLDPSELLHLFRYFNYIGQSAKGSGINTRVAADSSGIHCTSGGSRLSYRTHPDNTSIGTSATDFHNFTTIDVIN